MLSVKNKPFMNVIILNIIELSAIYAECPK